MFTIKYACFKELFGQTIKIKKIFLRLALNFQKRNSNTKQINTDLFKVDVVDWT
jgi:hypothetical protein